MRHILDADNRHVLARFQSMPTLCAFDFDGTLAPFVADQKAARMRPETLALFGELARRRPCAVVSGRARADLVKRLDDAPVIGIVGNHGIEPLQMDAAFALKMAAVRSGVLRPLEALDGVFVEDKTFTLAVHYRLAPDAVVARAAIIDVLEDVEGVRLLGGELVVNVIPVDAPHKGDALIRLLDREIFGAAIYVGDDETDEDVFRLESPPEILKVRVGYSAATSAAYFLEQQSEIDLLLEALLAPHVTLRCGR